MSISTKYSFISDVLSLYVFRSWTLFVIVSSVSKMQYINALYKNIFITSIRFIDIIYTSALVEKIPFVITTFCARTSVNPNKRENIMQGKEYLLYLNLRNGYFI